MRGQLWMPGIEHRDLTGRPGGAGNRVAGWRPKGIVLHVNDSPLGSYGTALNWYASGGGPDGVCPTWQVYPDGKGAQLLPANVQPWTQRDGNSWGVSIETGGNHAEPLTTAAIATIARIVRWMHDEWNVPLQITDHPSKPGLGTHQMGGAAWGGHPCPGAIRANQRHAILAAAGGQSTGELTMDAEAKAAFAAINRRLDAIPAQVWDHEIDFQPGTKSHLRAKASIWLAYANRYALSGLGVAASRTRKLFRQDATQ